MYRVYVVVAAAVGLSAALHSLPARAYAYDGLAEPLVLEVQPAGETPAGLSLPLIDMAASPEKPRQAEPPKAQDEFRSGPLGMAMVGAGMVAWVWQRRKEQAMPDEDESDGVAYPG